MLEFKNVTTKEDIRKLKEGSAFTFENVPMHSLILDHIYDILHNQYNALIDKDIEIYKFTGADLKEAFPKVSNFPDDNFLISIPLGAFVSIDRATMAKLEIGAAWLDEVVDDPMYW